MKHQIKSSAIFSSMFSTTSGIQIQGLRFNAALNVWFGTVSEVPHAWDSEGRCIDRSRAELDFFSS
jgi:hypothetical protein